MASAQAGHQHTLVLDELNRVWGFGHAPGLGLNSTEWKPSGRGYSPGHGSGQPEANGRGVPTVGYSGKGASSAAALKGDDAALAKAFARVTETCVAYHSAYLKPRERK